MSFSQQGPLKKSVHAKLKNKLSPLSSLLMILLLKCIFFHFRAKIIEEIEIENRPAIFSDLALSLTLYVCF